VHNHSYENEFNLHVNELSLTYERMGTKIDGKWSNMIIGMHIVQCNYHFELQKPVFFLVDNNA